MLSHAIRTMIAETLPESYCISLFSQDAFLIISVEFIRSKYVKRESCLHFVVARWPPLEVGNALGTA